MQAEQEGGTLPAPTAMRAGEGRPRSSVFSPSRWAVRKMDEACHVPSEGAIPKE